MWRPFFNSILYRLHGIRLMLFPQRPDKTLHSPCMYSEATDPDNFLSIVSSDRPSRAIEVHRVATLQFSPAFDTSAYFRPEQLLWAKTHVFFFPPRPWLIFPLCGHLHIGARIDLGYLIIPVLSSGLTQPHPRPVIFQLGFHKTSRSCSRHCCRSCDTVSFDKFHFSRKWSSRERGWVARAGTDIVCEPCYLNFEFRITPSDGCREGKSSRTERGNPVRCGLGGRSGESCQGRLSKIGDIPKWNRGNQVRGRDTGDTKGTDTDRSDRPLELWTDSI